MGRMDRTANGGTEDGGMLAANEHSRDEVEEASLESMDASDPPAFSGITGVGGAGSTADDEHHERIAARAHELWLEAGSPEGVALDFWLQAEREIEGGTVSRGQGE